MRPDGLSAVLDRLLPADIEANGRVELQRPTARGGLGRPEHDADLLADLVDEDDRAARAGDGGRQLPERLRHQSGLQARQRVAHVAVERTRVSAISRACSPVSGWEMSSSSVLTPRFLAYFGSRACSASMKAAVPPMCWASAMMWSASVVLPEDSGP